MSNKGIFKHSVPVPRIYKIASKVAKNAKSGKDSLKNLVYQEKHVNIKTVYALVVETFKRDAVIEELIGKSELLIKEPRFDPWLAKILICEMLWGKNKMKGDSKPLQTILGYEELLKKILADCTDVKRDVLKHHIVKPRYVRVNTLKITMEEAINNFRDEGWTLVKFFNDSDYEGFLDRLNNLEPNEFMLDLHIPELLIFPPKTEFHYHEAYKTRSIILQDKASCLPVFLMNPTPGATVIDMCAAPGMKTTQLAAMLKNSGILHAVELDKNREKILRDFVESAGATCVRTILKDVMQVNEADCPGVEYILVDPSCTGSGITDRVEIDDPNFHDRIGRLRKLCNFQAKLLRHATTSFPQAKRIVYSTCSMNAEENEDVVRQILETCKDFKLIDAKKRLKSWNDSSSEVFPVLGKMCIYATPEKDKTNGFFIAVLERLDEGDINPYLNVELCKLFDRGKKVRKSNSQRTKEETHSQKVFEKIKQQKFEVGHEIDLGSEIKMKDNKLKKETQDHKLVQGVEIEMMEVLDDTFINEKNKRKKIKCNETTDTLKEQHLDFNNQEKKKKKKSYEKNIINEFPVNISEIGVDKNFTRNKIELSQEEKDYVNSKTYYQNKKQYSEIGNEASVENSNNSIHLKKDNKKSKEDKKSLSKKKKGNEDSSEHIHNHDESTKVSTSDVNSKKSNKRKFEKLANQNDDILKENLIQSVKSKKNRKKRNQYEESCDAVENSETTIDHFVVEENNLKKKKNKNNSSELLIEIGSSAPTSDRCEDIKLKKKKKLKHVNLFYNNDNENADNLEDISNLNKFHKAKKHKKSHVAICKESENSDEKIEIKKEIGSCIEKSKISNSSANDDLVEKIVVGKLRKNKNKK